MVSFASISLNSPLGCSLLLHFVQLTLLLSHTATPFSFQPIVSISHDSDGWDTSSQEQKDGCYAALVFFCHKPYPL